MFFSKKCSQEAKDTSLNCAGPQNKQVVQSILPKKKEKKEIKIKITFYSTTKYCRGSTSWKQKSFFDWKKVKSISLNKGKTENVINIPYFTKAPLLFTWHLTATLEKHLTARNSWGQRFFSMSFRQLRSNKKLNLPRSQLTSTSDSK